MPYPPLLLGACLKLSEASGISAQKGRRAGEVGAGAGEQLSRRPGQRGTGRVWSPPGARGSGWAAGEIGGRGSAAVGASGLIPSTSAARAGREVGDAPARRGLGELWPGGGGRSRRT